MAETQIWSEEAFGNRTLGYCLELLSRFSGVGSDDSGLNAVSIDEPALAGVEEVSLDKESEMLTHRIEGIRALAVIGLDGRIHDHVYLDPTLGREVLTELATLLRIACRASHDAGSGHISETTWSSDGGTVLTRRIDDERFLMLVGRTSFRASLARYVLRQAASRIAVSGTTP